MEQREDLNQLITVALAAIQRERATSEQFYVRARNLAAFLSALFVAVQAAFLTNLTKEDSAGDLVLSSGQGTAIGIVGGIAGILLVSALVILFVGADAPRRSPAITVDELVDIAAGKTPEDQTDLPPMAVVLAKLASEERGLRESNESRVGPGTGLAVAASLAVVATVVELALLFLALR